MLVIFKIDNGWRQVAHLSLQLLAESRAKCRGTLETTAVIQHAIAMFDQWMKQLRSSWRQMWWIQRCSFGWWQGISDCPTWDFPSNRRVWEWWPSTQGDSTQLGTLTAFWRFFCWRYWKRWHEFWCDSKELGNAIQLFNLCKHISRWHGSFSETCSRLPTNSRLGKLLLLLYNFLCYFRCFLSRSLSGTSATLPLVCCTETAISLACDPTGAVVIYFLFTETAISWMTSLGLKILLKMTLIFQPVFLRVLMLGWWSV